MTDRAGRRRRTGGLLALAGGIAVLSVSSGSVATGVLLTVALLAVTAGVLVAAALLLHLSRLPSQSEGDDDAGWWTTGADRVRAAVRVLSSRPWVSGPGLLRVVNAQLASDAASLVSPRGQRIAAPHLSLRFHPADLHSVAQQWPVWVLAAEFAAAYADLARHGGLRRVADAVWVHVVADEAVPLGRPRLVPAFGPPPDRDPEAEASALNTCPTATGAQQLVSPPPVNPTLAEPANPTVRLHPHAKRSA